MVTYVPEGFAAVDLSPDAAHQPVRLAVLAAREPAPETGPFVRLRSTLDAQVYLGCLLDAAGRVLQWVELWVQTAAGLRQAPAAASGALTNRVLDERWRSAAEALRGQDEDGCIWTGWEASHPEPLFIRAAPPEALRPASDAGERWRLCEDDALLERHGLAPYRSSLERYLVLREAGGERLVPAAPDAAAPLGAALGLGGDAWPFNPEGGLLLVRPFCPLDLSEYLDVLDGGVWEGVACGRARLDPLGLTPALGHASEPGRLFLEGSGAEARLPEVLYLRLRLLEGALRAVESFVRRTQRPLLNLDEASFRVALEPAGAAAPCLWTARVALVATGDAAELPLGGSEVRHFVRANGPDLSVYRPQTAGLAAAGRCGLRIRQTLPETRRGLSVEGTFYTRDALAPEPGDLVWLRLPTPAGPLELYARLEAGGGRTRGEWGFRTVEQRFDATQAGTLKALAGIPVQNVPYEVFPSLSTPCDLYALAVLAVRLLLANGRQTLPVALDGVLSLAREAEAAGAAAETLPAVVAQVFGRDPRWRAALGPQHLSAGGPDEAERAFGALPGPVWWEALSLVLKLFPGPEPFKPCRNLGDAPERALHEVFGQPLAECSRLADRVRRLLAGEAGRGQELLEVVRAFRRAGG